MAVRSPSSKTSSKPKIAQTESEVESVSMSDAGKEVMEIMKRLSKTLREFRECEGLLQDQLASRLDLSVVRYADLEKLQKINPEYGCSLALLVRLAQEKRLTLPDLIVELQGNKKRDSEKTELENDIVDLFGQIPFEKREEFVKVLGNKGKSETMLWWVELGLDLMSLPEKKTLEIEMDIQRAVLESGQQSEAAGQERRVRIFKLMEKILESDKKSRA
jgi:hypothetical protein